MVDNTRKVKFNAHSNDSGALVAIEQNKDIPFSIERVYYIYDVDADARRGFHSHTDLEQILICVAGEVSVLVKTPNGEEVVTLKDPSEGLYIGPMVWREMFNFSDKAVLLVLASRQYSEDDYIRSYDDYRIAAAEYFKSTRSQQFN